MWCELAQNCRVDELKKISPLSVGWGVSGGGLKVILNVCCWPMEEGRKAFFFLPFRYYSTSPKEGWDWGLGRRSQRPRTSPWASMWCFELLGLRPTVLPWMTSFIVNFLEQQKSLSISCGVPITLPTTWKQYHLVMVSPMQTSCWPPAVIWGKWNRIQLLPQL